MKRRNALALSLLAIAMILPLVPGCEQAPVLGSMPGINPLVNSIQQAKGKVRVALNGDFSRLRSTQASITDIIGINIYIENLRWATGPVKSLTREELASGGASASVTFDEVPAGDGTQVRVNVYGANSAVIGTATRSIIVVPEQVTNVSLTVQLEPTYVYPSPSPDPTPTPTPGPGGVAANITILDGPVIVVTPTPGVTPTPSPSVTPAANNGVVTTLAGSAGLPGTLDGTGGSARFWEPRGVAEGPDGCLYVTEYTKHTVRRVSRSGVVTTIAGSAGNPGFSDGTGSSARFWGPTGIAVDGLGNIYVADAGNNTIRKVTSAGIVSTVAGTTGATGTVDGTGTAARFNLPQGLAVDSVGNVFIADERNNTIRKMTPAGVVTTLAGSADNSGFADGAGSDARFAGPTAIAVDGNGTMFVVDAATVRKVTPSGSVTTLAGAAYSYGSVDGTGSSAQFSYPKGITVDAAGNLYVTDTNNRTIRKITQGGVVTTFAGSAGQVGSIDAAGTAARFSSPFGIISGQDGSLFVADYGSSTIRMIR